ncbi:nucleoside phosphorylase [Lacticigenium naphthae]|uniref:nucleoside phosphorylase n=1 Tax=Lacticigenium naphthae TaxID=515351 RepID=UPI0004250F23|nr:nucleoside phosphorylase [Lacticigenium naphthae]
MDKQPHIQLTTMDGAGYALLPGDPDRVSRVKKFLTDPVEIAYNREYRSVKGTYKGVPVLVVSTGIGGPSTAIAIEELKRIGVHTLIRIGSSGALQPFLKMGDLILCEGAIRDEGTSKAYISSTYPAVSDHTVLTHLRKQAEAVTVRHHVGVVRSHDSFYTDEEEAIDSYWSKKGVIGSDMETAALFTLARLRGLRAASILNVVVPYAGDLQAGINQLQSGELLTAKGEQNEIKLALETIVSLDNE